MASASSASSSSSAAWPPDDPAALDPLLVRLTAGSRLFRVHPDFLEATSFNPSHGAGGRFHFIRDGAGEPVPALYAAFSETAALVETVFHDVPVRPLDGRRVASRRLSGRQLSEIRTTRDLELVELHHPGLARLGLEPAELTATAPTEYPRTRAWAQALHDATDAAGLVWMSRLHNTERACLLFGDRVSVYHLKTAGWPLPLEYGRGLAKVLDLAEAAGIMVAEG